MDINHLKDTLKFLYETDLKGHQAPRFMQVIAAINKEIDVLEELTKQEKGE